MIPSPFFFLLFPFFFSFSFSSLFFFPFYLAEDGQVDPSPPSCFIAEEGGAGKRGEAEGREKKPGFGR